MQKQTKSFFRRNKKVGECQCGKPIYEDTKSGAPYLTCAKCGWS